MLKCKTLLTAATIALLIVNGFSFSGKKDNAIYYYKSGTSFQRLEPGHTTKGDPKERSITFGAFTDIDNWTTEEQCSGSSSVSAVYICSISFEEELTADGDNDGQLTLQEAINIVYNRFAKYDSKLKEHTLIATGNAIVNVIASNVVH